VLPLTSADGVRHMSKTISARFANATAPEIAAMGPSICPIAVKPYHG
jgi:hypothetical protein